MDLETLRNELMELSLKLREAMDEVGEYENGWNEASEQAADDLDSLIARSAPVVQTPAQAYQGFLRD